jgi:Tol biopolymer transport system component
MMMRVVTAALLLLSLVGVLVATTGCGGSGPSDGPDAVGGIGVSAVGKIAFDTFLRDDNRWDIFVMNADGTGATKVTPAWADDQHPSWSLNGQQIAFASLRGSWNIFKMNADGTGVTQLTSDILWEDEPAWSPEGRRIAYRKLDWCDENGCGSNIWVMNADGTGQRQLTFLPGYASVPAWSPDGRRIAFVGGYCIYWVGVTGGIAKLTFEPHYYEGLAWSPDGAKIAFGCLGNDELYDIFVMNADGTGVTRLTHRGYNPTWSPNGQRIAFSGSRAAGAGLFVMNADGTNVRKLTGSQFDRHGVGWSSWWAEP